MNVTSRPFQFSPETPFGVHLYPIFEKLYQVGVGKAASDFRFTAGVTQFSTSTEVVVTCLTYYAVIFGGRYLMTNVPAFRLSTLFQIHNALLTLVSGSLLALMVEQIFPKIYRHGLFYSVCAEEAWTQPLELLYYLNYLVKYWELADTLFMVAKKKKLEFLHYFHHSMTMVLCYVQLEGRTSVSWVPIVLNLTVHVLMYYYYFRTASGVRIWWKKYLTTMQITQFVIDLFVIYFCTYVLLAGHHLPSISNLGTCAGTDASALFGCGLLTSYLFLFISFYKATYKKKGAAADSSSQASKAIEQQQQLPKSKKIF
ncbi:GNS1/SUR4 family-domain-containing protein [Phycomyces nitens]|nr:GNS1/SUR4 family-domain-containing protein [Phycomyces nitens]